MEKVKTDSVWNKISFLGLENLDRQTAFLKYRDIILLNRLVTVLELLFICYLPIEIIFNGYDLVFIIIGQIFIMAVTLLLNYKGKFDAARWYFFIMAIMVTAPILYITPKEASNHLFLTAVSLIPVVMFKENWKIIAGFGFVFVLFYVIAFTRHLVDDTIDVPLKTLEFFSYIFNGMLFLILFFLMFYFKKINRDYESMINEHTQEIKLSKQIIEQRNKDITDSINYAQRIQSAILPPENYLRKFLPDFFIFYKPKDIVAGDFYWAEEENGYFFIAVCDCTGHGVPGAMVSVVCSNALNRAVKEFSLTDPGKILDKTRELVIDTFSKSHEDVKDGMDISLLVFEITPGNHEAVGNLKVKSESLNLFQILNFKSIHWAGANNPLWYIEQGNLKEIKADKQSIGKTDNPRPFTTHKISEAGRPISEVFLFSDGFADQFGGEKGKKFKYSNLQKLLLENASEKPVKMNSKLDVAFNNWKGDLEQVDDVCIIGIKTEKVQ